MSLNPLYGPKKAQKVDSEAPVIIVEPKPEPATPKQENSTAPFPNAPQPANPYAPINHNPTGWFKRGFSIIVGLNILGIFFCRITQPGAAMWFVFGAILFTGASALVTIQSAHIRTHRQRWPELLVIASIAMVVFSVFQLESARDRKDAKTPVTTLPAQTTR